MAKKRASAARQRKQNSSTSDPESALDEVASPAEVPVETAKPSSPPRPLDTLTPSGALDPRGSNLQATVTASSASADDDQPSAVAPDDPTVASDHDDEAGDTAPGEDSLLPPLVLRSHRNNSIASSCSSLSSNVPRSRSLVLNDNSIVLQAMPTSKVEVVEVVAEQSWLVTKLTIQLLWALRMSYKWILMALRLVTFVVVLLPALLGMVYYWGFDSHVHKNLIYGLNGRNLLDVYTVPSDKIIKPTNDQLAQQRAASGQAVLSPKNGPQDASQLKRPVVVFLSGGAWIIGYKGWGALMGKALASFGIVVVMPDYRNFPQGILTDMVEDASMAMQWVFDNVHHFGGDPENVTLVGQSAGAHIAMCTLLEQVEKRAQLLDTHADPASTSIGVCSPSGYSSCSGFSAPSQTTNDLAAILPHTATWELRQIRTFIGISGPYNIEHSIETFHRHGFDRSVVDRIMNHNISYFSPALRLFNYSEHSRAVELLYDFPSTHLYHGTADATVAWKSSEQLADAMASCGLTVEAQYFENKTHTDIIIEDPISGSDDLLLGQMIDVIKKRSPRDVDGKTVFQFADFKPPRQYYPGILVKAARAVNPF